MMEKSWAHRDLPRKKVKKYAATLTEDEVRSVVDADAKQGLVPVIVGSELESCQRYAIQDCQVWREFRIMDEMNDDPVWDYAVTEYVFKHGFQRFGSINALESYVQQLTAQKYGASNSS